MHLSNCGCDLLKTCMFMFHSQITTVHLIWITFISSLRYKSSKHFIVWCHPSSVEKCSLHQFVALCTLHQTQILHVRMSHPPPLLFVINIGVFLMSLCSIMCKVNHLLHTMLNSVPHIEQGVLTWPINQEFYAIVYCFGVAYLMCNLHHL
jgi:hypothetical protein